MIGAPRPEDFAGRGERLVRLNGRLAMFHDSTVDQNYWESRWTGQKIESVLDAHRKGQLGDFTEIFERYLPRDRPILEAGCGMGQLVMALHARGYAVEGLDYAAHTIERIRSIAPELNVRVGDIAHIDRPDGHYGAYISIGIFEHDIRGPLEGMREMRRVLAPGGHALVSVPFLNTRRRTLLSGLAEVADASGFYQYYYGADELEGFFREAGLDIVDRYPYGMRAGLTRDFALGRKLAERGFFHRRVRRAFNRACAMAPDAWQWRFAHMVMFVCTPARRTW